MKDKLTDIEIIKKCMKAPFKHDDNESINDWFLIKIIAFYTQDIDQITRIIKKVNMRDKYNENGYLLNTIKMILRKFN